MHVSSLSIPPSSSFCLSIPYGGTFIIFLGHLSHSGDLLLWVGIHHCPLCVVLRALSVNIFSTETTGPIFTKFGMKHMYAKETRNCKFHDPGLGFLC